MPMGRRRNGKINGKIKSNPIMKMICNYENLVNVDFYLDAYRGPVRWVLSREVT